MRGLFAVGLAAGIACALPVSARANGRFPEAQRLLEQPGDPNRLLLAATYGLLVTGDRGASWAHICELSFAQRSLEGDPLLEIMPDGSWLAGMQPGINRSSDCGCSFTPSLANPEQNVLDLTVDSAGNVVALVQDVTAFPGHLLLFESRDSARSWHLISTLPDDIPDGYTVDVAPSDPERIYVSAYAPKLALGVLIASQNRGASWTVQPIPGTNTTAAPYIGAVSPKHPDVVYVRTRAFDDSTDFAAQDSLLVSADAGSSWTTALHRQATLLGFALSPDGESLLAGYGDAVTAGFSTNPDDLGLYSASAKDLAFTKIFDGTITCLRWTERGVYACMAQDGVAVPSPGMTVGFAPNIDFTLANAAPFESLLDVTKVQGPLGCSAAICSDTWSIGSDSASAGSVAVCQQLGASCNVTAAADALTCPPPSVETGGAPDAGGASGAESSGSGGNAPSAGGKPTTDFDAGPSYGGETSGAGGTTAHAAGGGAASTSRSSQSGCGCEIPASAGRPWRLSPALAWLLLAYARRVRRRR